MIERTRLFLITWRPGNRAVGIIKAQDAPAGRIMQRKRIPQSMRPFPRWDDPLDFELQPETLFQVMNSAIKRQGKFQGVLVSGRLLHKTHYPVMIPQITRLSSVFASAPCQVNAW